MTNREHQGIPYRCVLFLPRERRRSIWLLGHRKLPAPPDSDQAQGDTYDSTHGGYRRGSGKNSVAEDHDSGARKGRDCVEFSGKDNRDFRNKQITGDASADASQHTHEHCCTGSKIEGDRLTGSGDRKESQSQGVEYLHRTFDLGDHWIPEERNTTRNYR
jgi:hypothetical protein